MKLRSCSKWLSVAIMVMMLASLLFPAIVMAAGGRTYTLNADFDEGILNGVQHDTVPDQLQLTVEGEFVFPFKFRLESYENLPNGGTKGKLSVMDGVHPIQNRVFESSWESIGGLILEVLLLPFKIYGLLLFFVISRTSSTSFGATSFSKANSRKAQTSFGISRPS